MRTYVTQGAHTSSSCSNMARCIHRSIAVAIQVNKNPESHIKLQCNTVTASDELLRWIVRSLLQPVHLRFGFWRNLHLRSRTNHGTRKTITAAHDDAIWWTLAWKQKKMDRSLNLGLLKMTKGLYRFSSFTNAVHAIWCAGTVNVCRPSVCLYVCLVYRWCTSWATWFFFFARLTSAKGRNKI